MQGERLGDLVAQRRGRRSGDGRPRRRDGQRAVERQHQLGRQRARALARRVEAPPALDAGRPAAPERRRPRPRLDEPGAPARAATASRAARTASCACCGCTRCPASARSPAASCRRCRRRAGSACSREPAVWQGKWVFVADDGGTRGAAASSGGALLRVVELDGRHVAGGRGRPPVRRRPRAALNVYVPRPARRVACSRSARATGRARSRRRPHRDRRGQRERPRHERRARHLPPRARRSAGAAAAHLRALLAERGVGERLQRLVQVPQLARDHGRAPRGAPRGRSAAPAPRR